ncbi:hypothetical protein Agub_g14049 [Astrephomene gubernaculifera]|uniref:SBP-type domain-containing protein n=1 Tax=Astrephomene gubernaculifera TaxID=47775 RepID=A0AAD3HSV2_9CHLO|nr:hypothetical protein Agub_g14049 [Astrephomene gubernaculifera]
MAHPDWDPAEYAWDGETLTASRKHPKRNAMASDTTPYSEYLGVDVPTLMSRPPVGALSKAHRLVCQIQGCNRSLQNSKLYYQRFKLCEEHLKAPAISIDGVLSRLCQQCGRFHELAAFEGKKRTCRAQLNRIRKAKEERKRNAGSPDSMDRDADAVEIEAVNTDNGDAGMDEDVMDATNAARRRCGTAGGSSSSTQSDNASSGKPTRLQASHGPGMRGKKAVMKPKPVLLKQEQRAAGSDGNGADVRVLDGGSGSATTLRVPGLAAAGQVVCGKHGEHGGSSFDVCPHDAVGGGGSSGSASGIVIGVEDAGPCGVVAGPVPGFPTSVVPQQPNQQPQRVVMHALRQDELGGSGGAVGMNAAGTAAVGNVVRQSYMPTMAPAIDQLAGEGRVPNMDMCFGAGVSIPSEAWEFQGGAAPSINPRLASQNLSLGSSSLGGGFADRGGVPLNVPLWAGYSAMKPAPLQQQQQLSAQQMLDENSALHYRDPQAQTTLGQALAEAARLGYDVDAGGSSSNDTGAVGDPDSAAFGSSFGDGGVSYGSLGNEIDLEIHTMLEELGWGPGAVPNLPTPAATASGGAFNGAVAASGVPPGGSGVAGLGARASCTANVAAAAAATTVAVVHDESGRPAAGGVFGSRAAGGECALEMLLASRPTHLSSTIPAGGEVYSVGGSSSSPPPHSFPGPVPADANAGRASTQAATPALAPELQPGNMPPQRLSLHSGLRLLGRDPQGAAASGDADMQRMYDSMAQEPGRVSDLGLPPPPQQQQVQQQNPTLLQQLQKLSEQRKAAALAKLNFQRQQHLQQQLQGLHPFAQNPSGIGLLSNSFAGGPMSYTPAQRHADLLLRGTQSAVLRHGPAVQQPVVLANVTPALLPSQQQPPAQRFGGMLPAWGAPMGADMEVGGVGVGDVGGSNVGGCGASNLLMAGGGGFGRVTQVSAGGGGFDVGGRGGAGGLPYTSNDTMTRVTIKLMNCLPEDLPCSLRANLQHWAAAGGAAEVLHACMRPGCLELVVDLVHSGSPQHFADLLTGGACGSRGPEAQAAQRALRRAITERLASDNEVILEVSGRVLCLHPSGEPLPGGPPPRSGLAGSCLPLPPPATAASSAAVLSWEEAAEAFARVDGTVAAAATAAAACNSPARSNPVSQTASPLSGSSATDSLCPSSSNTLLPSAPSSAATFAALGASGRMRLARTSVDVAAAGAGAERVNECGLSGAAACGNGGGVGATSACLEAKQYMPPAILGCSLAAARSASVLTFTLYGVVLDEQDVAICARMAGQSVPLVAAKPVKMTPSSSSTSSGVRVQVQVQPSRPMGLLVLEARRGRLLGEWWPLVVVADGGVAGELNALAEEVAAAGVTEAGAAEGAAAGDGEKTCIPAWFRSLLVDLGQVLDWAVRRGPPGALVGEGDEDGPTSSTPSDMQTSGETWGSGDADSIAAAGAAAVGDAAAAAGSFSTGAATPLPDMQSEVVRAPAMPASPEAVPPAVDTNASQGSCGTAYGTEASASASTLYGSNSGRGGRRRNEVWEAGAMVALRAAQANLELRMSYKACRLLAFCVVRGLVHTAQLLQGVATDLGMTAGDILNRAQYEGEELLTCAVRSRSRPMLEWLLALGGQGAWLARDLAQMGPEGLSPLHLAASLPGCAPLAELLLRSSPAAPQLWFTLRAPLAGTAAADAGASGGASPAEMAVSCGHEALNALAARLLRRAAASAAAAAAITAVAAAGVSGPPMQRVQLAKRLVQALQHQQQEQQRRQRQRQEQEAAGQLEPQQAVVKGAEGLAAPLQERRGEECVEERVPVPGCKSEQQERQEGGAGPPDSSGSVERGSSGAGEGERGVLDPPAENARSSGAGDSGGRGSVPDVGVLAATGGVLAGGGTVTAGSGRDGGGERSAVSNWSNGPAAAAAATEAAAAGGGGTAASSGVAKAQSSRRRLKAWLKGLVSRRQPSSAGGSKEK